jgi:ligand-binding sensor domain-containing protein
VLTCQLALWLPLLLLMSSAVAYAERLPIKNYTTAEGLGDNWVIRIVKDSRGFLWFCTAAGLSRFDGYAFATAAAAYLQPA